MIFRALRRFPLTGHGYLNAVIWGSGILIGYSLLVHGFRGIGFIIEADLVVAISIAIAMNLGVLVWAIKHYDKDILDASLEWSDLPQSERQGLVDSQLGRIYDDRLWVKWFIPWAIFAAVLHELGRQRVASFLPGLQDLLQYFPFYVYSFLVLQFAAFLLAGSIFLFVSHIQFLADISGRPPRTEPLEELPSLNLSGVSRLSQLVSLAWFVAVGVLGVSLLSPVTVENLSLLGVLVAIGIVAFLLPELYLHFMLVGLKQKGVERALAKFREALASEDATSATLWLQIASAVRSMREWAFPASMAAQVGLSAFIPVGLTLLFSV